MINLCFAEHISDPFNGIDITITNNLISIQGNHSPLAAIIDRACWAFHNPCSTKSIHNITDVSVDDLSWLEWLAWLKEHHKIEYHSKQHTFSQEKDTDAFVALSYKPSFSSPQILLDRLKNSGLSYSSQSAYTSEHSLFLKTKDSQQKTLLSFLEHNDCEPNQIEIKTDIIAIDFEHLQELGIDPSQALGVQPKKTSQYNFFLAKIKNLETLGLARVLAKPQLHMMEGETASIENKEYFENHPLTLNLTIHSETYGLHGLILNIHLRHQYLNPQKDIVQNELKTFVYAQNHQLIVLGGLKELVSLTEKNCLIGMRHIPILKNVFCLNQATSHNQLLLILLSPEIKQQCKL